MAYDTQEERLKVQGSEQITRDLKVAGDVYVGGDLTVNNASLTTALDKLAGIESGAEVNVQADWNQTDISADDYIKNKPTIPEVVNVISDENMNAITSNAVYNDVVKYEPTDNFTVAFSLMNVSVTRVCVFNNKIYVGTSSNGIYESSDGVTFTQNTSFPTNYGVRGAMYAFGGKMYVGTNGHGLYVSSDGVTFTQNTSIPSRDTVQPGGTYNGKIYVGVNSKGIYESSDGVTFTQNTSFPTTHTATTFIEYNNNFYVITGGSTAAMNKGIYVSSDGVTFTQNTSFPTNYGCYSATVYNNKLYIGTTGYGLYESSDGVTFTRNTSFPTTHNVLLLTVYNNWLYIGTANAFYKTNDGITYINVVTSAGIGGTGYQAVEKNGLLYVALAGYGLMVNSISQSTFMDVLFKLFATKEYVDAAITQVLNTGF